MNNFPAMTEERRQELIKHCKYNILQANGILPTIEGIDPNSEVARKVRKELELQEIAIAALTADTSKLAELAAKVRKVREDAADFDGDRRGMWEHQEEQEQLLLEEAVKYTAPATQLLRPVELPEPYDDGHGNLWLPQDAVISAVKNAGGEVKS